MSAQEVIDKLKLIPHPEGGFYKETYRSDHTIVNEKKENRHVCTAIYYLLEDEGRSLFHRIRSDELWFFHQGQPLEIVLIQGGHVTAIILGNDIEKGEQLQAMIPANTWFAARIKNANGFSLVSCAVSPGFDFADFDLAKRNDLFHQFPHLKEVIEKFTQ
jgi:predicted cupin superfamily sugar epimerase